MNLLNRTSYFELINLITFGSPMHNPRSEIFTQPLSFIRIFPYIKTFCLIIKIKKNKTGKKKLRNKNYLQA
jgi:hypothetical protein